MVASDFLPDSNVPVMFTLLLEKSIMRGWISRKWVKALHLLNLISVLVLPVYVINTTYEYIGPGDNFVLSPCFSVPLVTQGWTVPYILICIVPMFLEGPSLK